VSSGIATRHGSPAAAAYAAAALPALPADGNAIPFRAHAMAPFTAITSPRALNDCVGFGLSSFIHSPASPSSRARWCSGRSGVPPSPRRTTGNDWANGSSAR